MTALSAGSPTVERVLRLQRMAGNAAVGRLLRAVVNDIEVPAAVNHTHGSVLQDDHALRHERHTGVAFVRDRGEDATGVDPSDIRQGFIGDCFFLSPLMATARINPRRIYNMVRGPIGESPSGGDAYEVKLYNADGDLVTHHVDDRFVSNADGTPRYSLVSGHSYNVESATRSDREIDVANPHGRNHLRSLDVGELPDDLRVVRHPRRVGAVRLELHETGQSQVHGVWVSAANIWEREPIGGAGPSALRAQITVDEELPVDVAEGETVEIAGARWRVAEITQDPAHRRGGVVLERD